MRKLPLHEKGGVITEKGGNLCTIRVRVPAGIISNEEMEGVCRIATKYCAGIHLTTRQSLELIHVNPADMAAVVKELEENGTPLGAEKAEIVNVTACPGTDRCRLAQIDSIALGIILDEKFFGRDMPVKARIAVSSCPNSCMSEKLNEVGITGVVKPYRLPGTCTGCGTCGDYCLENAIKIVNGTLSLNEKACVCCGMCINSCPFRIIKSDPPVYHISVGGRRGRHPQVGRDFVTVKSVESVVACVDMITKWIYRKAFVDKLLPDQLDELGFNAFREEVIKALPPEEIVEGY